MAMLNTADILETVNMIREENLDIRTITMGISLFDCVSEDEKRLSDNIYDKITRKAEKLVKNDPASCRRKRGKVFGIVYVFQRKRFRTKLVTHTYLVWKEVGYVITAKAHCGKHAVRYVFLRKTFRKTVNGHKITERRVRIHRLEHGRRHRILISKSLYLAPEAISCAKLKFIL